MPRKKHPPGEGSYSKYKNLRCRCAECRRANREYTKDWRQTNRPAYRKIQREYARRFRRKHPKFPMTKRDHMYTPVRIEDVPEGLSWKLTPGTARHLGYVLEYSMGRIYKRVTDKRTGDAIYYRLLDLPEATPAEVIDSEPTTGTPTLGGQTRYHVGNHCWFIDTDERWYLCTVVARTPHRITIRPVTGRDADREKDWPYGGELEFPCNGNNRVFQRLRPLRMRTP